MTSTLGGDDEAHDFSPSEKDKKERKLRTEGEELRKKGKPEMDRRKRIELTKSLVASQKGLIDKKG